MKTMRRLTALFAALLLLAAATVGAAAETNEVPSDSFTLQNVQQRQEEDRQDPDAGNGNGLTFPGAQGEQTPAPGEGQTPAPQYQRDENGALILDENGNPIPLLAEGETAPAGYERDADGNLILDENGNPIPVAEAPEEDVETPAGGGEQTPEPEEQETPEIEYEQDADGNLILDEDGNPIPKAEEPEETPAQEEEAEAPTTVEELLDGEQSVTVTAAYDGEPGVGSQVTLHAVLSGFDGVVYTLQWQTSADGVMWSDIEGATEDSYTLTVTQENCFDQWRVSLTATDVL